jgi:protein involved in polysaccharide export with SLBB domain
MDQRLRLAVSVSSMVVAFCVPSIPAIAATGQNQKSPTSPEETVQAPGLPKSPVGEPSGDLFGAERLAIRVQGYPELTGEYRINLDGTISIPFVGRVSVVNMDASALEKAIADKTSEIASREIFVTVEVASFRPVFVTGQVKNSGSSPWRPGITVLQAVAMSGGVSNGLAESSDGNDVARLRKASDDSKRALASLARLRAEQNGAASIETPAALVALVGKKEADELIAREGPILASRRNSKESQLQNIQQRKQLAQQELDGLQSQRARLEDQLNARRDYQAKLRELLSKGLVREERSMEADIVVFNLEDKRASLSVALAQVQNVLASLDRDAMALTLDRKATVESEITKLERDVAQLNIEIETAKGTGMMYALEAQRRPVSYQIIRGSSQIAAAPATALMPGDVVIVAQEE